jgi:hypothetical protein
MNDRLRQALAHIEELPPIDQEQLADIINDMWQSTQLPPFDPTQIPEEPGDFDAEMAELDRIREKSQRVPRS